MHVARGDLLAFAPDGRELYFVDGDALQAVSIDYEPIRIGDPRVLFRGRYTFGVEGRAWDVHPNGQRFLMLVDEPQDAAASSAPERQRIHFVVNWIEQLQRRLPAR